MRTIEDVIRFLEKEIDECERKKKSEITPMFDGVNVGFIYVDLLIDKRIKYLQGIIDKIRDGKL